MLHIFLKFNVIISFSINLKVTSFRVSFAAENITEPRRTKKKSRLWTTSIYIFGEDICVGGEVGREVGAAELVCDRRTYGIEKCRKKRKPKPRH